MPTLDLVVCWKRMEVVNQRVGRNRLEHVFDRLECSCRLPEMAKKLEEMILVVEAIEFFKKVPGSRPATVLAKCRKTVETIHTFTATAACLSLILKKTQVLKVRYCCLRFLCCFSAASVSCDITMSHDPLRVRNWPRT